MEYGKLGNSGIVVSRLCLGCMSFGDPASGMHAWTLDPDKTDEIVAYALDLGVNFFDTANCYSAGTSEQYLSRAIKNHVSRDKVVIATKVYFNEGHLSKQAILREIDGSLKRLNTDYVDLYIIHRFDYDTPPEETMSALDSLVKCGKVRALGASAMYKNQFETLQETAKANGLTKFVSMQNHYNLLYREDEKELIPYCDETGVSRTPYSPLAAGRLSRPTWQDDTSRSATDKTAMGKYDSTRDQDKKICERVRDIAEKHGVTMTQIALGWHFKKGVTAPIIGATKTKYLLDAVGAFDVNLSPDEMNDLEKYYLPHKVMGAI